MNFSHKLASSLAVLACLATPAAAGGLADSLTTLIQPAPALENDDWTGFYAGGALGQVDATVTLNGMSGSREVESHGGFVGYNYDLGRIVIGAEISYDVQEDNRGLFEHTRLKARIGYDAGRWMPFVLAGTAKVRGSGTGSPLEKTGRLYGAGIDYRLGQNLIVGTEFSRSDVDDVMLPGMDYTFDTVQLRLSYKF